MFSNLWLIFSRDEQPESEEKDKDREKKRKLAEELEVVKSDFKVKSENIKDKETFDSYENYAYDDSEDTYQYD